MARGRIEQQIDLRVNGLAEAQQAEQLVDDMDGKRATASVSVEAKGEGEVRSLAQRLEGLTDDQKRIVLQADISDAERDIAKIDRQLRDAHKLSGDEIRVLVSARDEASARIDNVRAEMRSLPREVEVEFNASGDLGGMLDSLPGKLGEVAGALGPGGALAGGAAALATGLFEAASSAADMALSAQTTADLTGSTVEDASRLQSVWKLTGADVNDLNDVVLQMNGVLQQSPQLARQIGVNLNDGADLAQRFVEVVGKVSASTGDAAQRAQLMSSLFGEEGVRQVQALVTAIDGDLQGALGNVSDISVISPGEVEQARKFKQQMAEVNAKMAELGVILGQTVLPLMTDLMDLAGAEGPIPGENWVEFFGGPLVRGFEQAAGGLALWNKAQQASSKGSDAIADAVTVAATATGQATEAGSAYTQQLFEMSSAQLAVAAAGKLVGTAAAEQRIAVQLQAGVFRDAVVAMEELANAQRASADQAFAVRDAQRSLADQLAASFEVLKGSDATLGDWAREMDNVAQASGKLADEQAKMASDTAEATGAAFDAQDAQRVWNRSMVESARTVDGPMRQAIAQYIADVNGIPVETVTDILANPDYATIDAAQDAIERAAEDQRANILVTDNGTADAVGRDIRENSKDQTTRVNVIQGTGWDIFNPRTIRTTATASGGSERPVRAPAASSGPAALAGADDAEPRTDGAYETIGSSASDVWLTVPSAPALAPVNVNVQLSAAVIGNRFDVERAVRRATRDGVRLAGRRDRGVT